LTVEVQDTGIGMTPDMQARLFQRFVQGDSSLTRTFGGSGLGLAICKALADKMGGEIAVKSAPDNGSLFQLSMPLLPAAGVEPAAPTPAPDAIHVLHHPGGVTADEEPPVKVLVAEDHPANRRIIELMLAPMGAAVTLVSNGAEALTAFKQGGWELVLMDMQMPVLDGVSAVRSLREVERENRWPRTPVAMLSANVLPRHVEEAMNAGADHFIAKPVTPAALAMGLDELIKAAAVNAAKALQSA
jgi:CheY-like chemotaxis protein